MNAMASQGSSAEEFFAILCSRNAQARAPFDGVLRGVEDEVDDHPISVELVENFEWKAAHQCAAEVIGSSPKGLRIALRAREGRLDGTAEFTPSPACCFSYHR